MHTRINDHVIQVPRCLILMDKSKKKQTILEVKHFQATGRFGEKKIVIERVTDESETAQFLNRVETQRLNKPYDGAIDMRDKVLFPCKQYQYQNKTHYLDDISLNIFKNEVKNNHGELTVGTFEKIIYGDHTMENRPVRPVDVLHGAEPAQKKKPPPAPKKKPVQQAKPAPKKTATEQKQPPPANTQEPTAPSTYATTQHAINYIRLGYHLKRTEPRLQYKMKLSIHSNGGEYEAISKDISPHGIRFALTQEKNITFEPNSTINISFPMLTEKEAHFSEESITYKIIENNNIEGQNQVCCQLVSNENNQWLNEFFTTFIENESTRYKLDPEDELLTRSALCYGQVYNHNLKTLPIYFSKNADNIAIDTIGITKNNMSLLDFLKTNNFSLDFSAFRLPQRNKHFLPQSNREGQSSLMILFKNDENIYSFTDFELESKQALLKALSYAKQQKDYRVFKIDALPITQATDDRTLNLLAENLFHNSEEEFSILKLKLAHLCGIGLLTDVTSVFSRTDLPVTSDSLEAHCWLGNNKVHVYNNSEAVETSTLTPEPQHLLFKHYPARREPRYLARTKIEVEINGIRRPGTTRDLSVKGLRAELDEHLKIDKGETISVGFLSFKQKRSGFDINNISYKIRDVYYEENKTILSLIRVKDDQWVHVTAFFEDIIEVNRSKLRVCINDVITSTMASVHENIFNNHISSQPFFLSRSAENNITIESITNSTQDNIFTNFFSNTQDLDFSALTNANIVKQIHENITNDLGEDSLELYFHKAPDEQGNIVIHSTSNHQLKNNKERLEHIKKCLTTQDFLFVKVVAASSQANVAYTENQINSLRELSRHSAGKLQQELEQIIGYGELVDITDEVSLALGFY